MTDKDLTQYLDLKKEIEEIESKIAKLESDILRIEDGECVVDSVTGGNGGKQHFKIEGIPFPEYRHKRTLLYSRKATLELLKEDLLERTNEVEKFIASVSDSRIRRIINLRFLEDMSWNQVAGRIGGGNTEDSVRKAYKRYVEK